MEAQVLLVAEVLVDCRLLEDEADRVPNLATPALDVEAVYGGCSGIRAEQRAEHVDRRGLACAIRSQEAEELTFVEILRLSLRRGRDERLYRVGDRVSARAAAWPPCDGRPRQLAPRRAGRLSPRRRGADDRDRRSWVEPVEEVARPAGQPPRRFRG